MFFKSKVFKFNRIYNVDDKFNDMKNHFWAALSLLACAGCTTVRLSEKIDSVSGIYPSLAYYNNEGECGTGAVVSWADRKSVV